MPVTQLVSLLVLTAMHQLVLTEGLIRDPPDEGNADELNCACVVHRMLLYMEKPGTCEAASS